MSASKWISYRSHPWNHKVLQIPFFYFSSSFLFIYIFFGMSVALPMLIWMMMMTCYICTQTYANVSFMAPTNINKNKNFSFTAKTDLSIAICFGFMLAVLFLFYKMSNFFSLFCLFFADFVLIWMRNIVAIDKWRIFFFVAVVYLTGRHEFMWPIKSCQPFSCSKILINIKSALKVERK